MPIAMVSLHRHFAEAAKFHLIDSGRYARRKQSCRVYPGAAQLIDVITLDVKMRTLTGPLLRTDKCTARCDCVRAEAKLSNYLSKMARLGDAPKRLAILGTYAPCHKCIAALLEYRVYLHGWLWYHQPNDFPPVVSALTNAKIRHACVFDRFEDSCEICQSDTCYCMTWQKG